MPRSSVVISEIMYHPVDEITAEDDHEFVELFNSGTVPVAISGWKLLVDGKARLTLPPGTTLAAGERLVLAKNKSSLLAVTRYALASNRVVGDFSGELDNGGATVALADESGKVVDSVTYDDEEPWPVGADAFGAQEEWLPELAPFVSHQFLGRSLERFSPRLPGSDPRNWEASPVDGATPGRENSVSGEPPAIVLSASAGPDGGSASDIRPEQKVRVSVVLSEGATSELSVEYRLDTLEKTGSTTSVLPLAPRAGAPDTYEAVLPKAPANTVVRYRVLSGSGSASTRLYPRQTDPREWHAYFVGAQLPSGRAYQLFIAPDRWTALWQNISPGVSTRCTINDHWDDTVPAVFVHEGKVYDVQVRYQGSRYRRTDGIPYAGWTAPGPKSPSPFQILSWHVKFPRYDEFDGQKSINLNKLKQACPGVLNALEAALLEQAGVPVEDFRFARFYINGAYYTYAMEVTGLDDRAMQRFEGKGKPLGDLFKSEGTTTSDSDAQAGPWGRGDWTPLTALCNETATERYQRTYERQSNDYKGLTPAGHQALQQLIEDLDGIQATEDEDPAVRAYFQRYFDVDELISEFAARNWAGVWDDGFHNYYPYQRGSDGKWLILPQDFDCDFGGDPVDCGDGGRFYNPSNLSFFHPETGNGVTVGGPLRLKVQLIRAFRSEFAARVRELGDRVFSASNVDAALSTVLAGFDRAAWAEAPARYCDLDERVSEAHAWLGDRRAFFAQGVR